MDAFRQLSRGIKFDKKRFADESAKFGLVKQRSHVDDDSGNNDQGLAALPSGRGHEFELTDNYSLNPDDIIEDDVGDHTEEEEDFDEEEVELTLLGDIKVRKKKRKTSTKIKKQKTREKLRLLHQEAVNRFRRVHRIHVSGTDIPDPVDTWDKLKERFGVPENLLATITEHYPAPTPIQMQTIPMLLERREVLACAPTGSGKTAAYLIPIVHLLQAHRKKTGFRVVIVAPTRELALQIHRETVKFAECRELRTLVLDQMNKATKHFDLKTAKRYDILVSTPNKLAFMIKGDKLALHHVEWLIIDESDKLFEAGPKGFRDQLAVIYRACDKAQVRRAMFSATLAVDVENWCKLNLDNVLTVTIGERNTAVHNVRQRLVYTGTEKGKLMAIKQLVQEGLKPPVLVFVQTKERAKDLAKALQEAGRDLKVDVIHSDRSQLQRDDTVKAFRAGRVWILICTELMGRGIDFKGVNMVVNYDFPPTTVSYIHRIGRTGRAGRSGQAVTFFTDADKILLRSVASIIKAAGGDVPDYTLQMKKASQQEKRKLARHAVEREDINPESKYDRAKRIKQEQIVAASKRKKRKAMEALQKGNDRASEVKRPKIDISQGTTPKKKAQTAKKSSSSEDRRQSNSQMTAKKVAMKTFRRKKKKKKDVSA